MAGRGTDIVLGGSLDVELQQLEDESKTETVKSAWQKRHDAVLESGGLHIIGTERHESRRIDNQLRGRSGRQGDTGSSRFYLSMEDNLMRIFASDKVRGLMQKLGMQAGESIEHPWVSKAIENAQRKVEAHNFDIRKNLLEYDDVANDQRKVVYEQRRELMLESDISENLADLREDVVEASISEYMPSGSMEEQWDVDGLSNAFKNDFGLSLPVQQWLDDDDKVAEEEVRDRIHQRTAKLFQEKEDRVGPEVMRGVEKNLMLNVLDERWKEHLAAMDYLRQGISLRSYAQKNPKQEYKREAFGMFQEMLEQIKHETVSLISRVELPTLAEIKAMEAAKQVPENIQYQHAQADDVLHPEQAQGAAPEAEQQAKQEPFKRTDKKIGRNDPCHCGSGKKYKQCHGKLT